jgi:hypothetical protein
VRATRGPHRPAAWLAVCLVAGCAVLAVASTARARATSPTSAAIASTAPPAAAFAFTIEGASFEQVMAVPQFRALAARGGAALLVPQTPVAAELDLAAPDRLTRVDLGTVPPSVGARTFMLRAGARVRSMASAHASASVLVVGTRPSRAMTAAKDGVLPVVAAEGTPAQLFAPSAAARALTSDSTRRTGVVSSADLGATLDAQIGGSPTRPPAAASVGAPMRAVDEPAPFSLHARYLDMRRMSVPIQAAALVYVAVAASALVVLVAMRGRVPTSSLRRSASVGLTVPVLAAALLAAGHLPTLSYLSVVPFVVAVTLAGTLAAATLARRDVLAPPAAIGGGVLGFFVVEAVLGFSAALTPFVGGSELDGGRFYGLPNVFEGLLIGCALYVAASWSPRAGAAVLVATALFMGLPQIGADIGGALAGFAAAGIWVACRRRRLDARAALEVIGVVVLGMAVVLAAHRFLPGTPTHATRFVEGDQGVWTTIGDRLRTSTALVVRNPLALLPAVGIVVVAAVFARPPRPVRIALDAVPRWRDALLTLSLAGIVALVGNDTGPAAAGLAFGLALGGLLYVSLSMLSGKMTLDEPVVAALD